MSIIPEDGFPNDSSSSEDFKRDLMPYKIEIDGFNFTRAEPGGEHKIPYRNPELNQIALLPNPVKFDTLEDKELQVDIWQHNGKRYKEAGLPTADQNFNDNGNLVESGYTTGKTRVNGEEHPFLRCYFNPHLNSIDYVRDRARLYADKREEIIDAVITLDHLKREGEIATAENTADWEEIVNELEVVTERDMLFENGETIHQRISTYQNRPNGEAEYLIEDFRQGLLGNTTVPERDEIYFKNDINPRELVLEETGLPSSANGLLGKLKYNDKTGDIVVADLGECGEAIFNEESNRYEVRFNSINEFANYHGITSSYDNRISAALDD